ncbi:MAG: peptidoglycan-binding protein [Cyanobacteria bacterium P01_D01_bin.1]
MKQLTVCALGWGALSVALIHLPALAVMQPASRTVSTSKSTSNTLLSISLNSDQLSAQPSSPLSAQPGAQLLAVGLSRRTLRPGDTGADVRSLQLYLGRNGLYPFEVDGVYGQETANGVATYQRIRDLPATGIADEETLRDMEFEFLFDRAAPVSPPTAAAPTGSGLSNNTLAPGSTGNDVVALQQRLNEFGIPVFVDGIYGFETQQGVRTYQRVQGLPVTGNADRETLSDMGFSVSGRPSLPYISAVIADEAALPDVQRFFPEAYIDRTRGGRFINIGSFDSRSPAEARVDAAAARGYNTRVIYRRRGFFR